MDATDAGSEIEREWKIVDRLLAQRTPAANAVAVIEAQKIFALVLDEVSYGPSVEDRIHNAAGLFSDVHKILAAEGIYEGIVMDIGCVVTNKDAKAACDAWLRGALELLGRDFEPRGSWARIANSLNFFWGHHPRFLSGFLLLVVGYVAVTWFFTEISVGRWLSAVGVGFAHFVLDRPIVMGGLVIAFLISWLASRAFRARRHRE